MIKKFSCLMLICLAYSACTTPRKEQRKDNNKNKYETDNFTIRPEFIVYNLNDKESELHFKIASKELLYTRPDGINFYSNVLISFRLYNSFDSKDILDSTSTRIVDLNNESVSKFLIGTLPIKTPIYKRYFLRITVSDLNRNVVSSNVVAFEKETDLGRNNFLVKSKKDNVPLFKNTIKPNEEVSIQYKSALSVALYVRYYKRDFPLAAPAFSTVEQKPFLYKPDSTFTIQLNKEGMVNFSTTKKGFYHFQLDTSRKEGLTLYCFSNYFPEIKTPEDMIPSLRFITSYDEYNELVNSVNKKASVEKFWLNCAGSEERAKEVIRKYYNRMQDANYFFTSFVEGWKTDRGMIFLIYGQPSTIYRKANSETWVYGDDNNINSLLFTFSKVINPFTDNDYTLERSPQFKQSWYIGVDNWRQGKVNGQD